MKPNIISKSSEIGNTSNILEPLVFKNCRVDFRKVSCFQLNFQAFETRTVSHNESILRPSKSDVRLHVSKATKKIVLVILECGKNDHSSKQLRNSKMKRWRS
jgi:hypothetical protein